MTENASFTNTLEPSWKLVKNHLKFLLPAIVGSAVIFILLQEFQNRAENHTILSLVAFIVSTIAGIAISLGWSNVILKFVRHSHATWSDFKTDTKIWVHYFLARIIYGIGSLVAMSIAAVPLFMSIYLSMHTAVFLIIGTIVFICGLSLFAWLLTRYLFISLVAIDHPTLNGWKLLKESAKITKGHMWKLFGFILLVTLINIVGALLLIIGLAFTVPVTMIAVGYVYDHLKKHTK